MLTPQRSVAGLRCTHEVVRNSWKKYNGWADGCNQSNLHPEDLDADGTHTMGTIVVVIQNREPHVCLLWFLIRKPIRNFLVHKKYDVLKLIRIQNPLSNKQCGTLSVGFPKSANQIFLLICPLNKSE
ncbi:unnamed protein product [Orchesella dallaii]|uniref:Uncharacterized protein n=1 Tax=Orchesella dallaii TaxID=48710 RepID=A0ABP1PMW0_9HEXA